MKLNIAYPATGCQKVFDFEDEKKVRIFYDKRVSQEVDGTSLGDEWKGYVFRIGGGNDKQGFPMKQGVLTNQRVRLLLGKGHSCYRPRRTGERKRKSVRGCIVDGNLSVLSLVIVKKGDQDIPGLTDTTIPRRLGPKRASKIRKLFNLSKQDDVRQYVLRRPVTAKEGKEGKKVRTKAPKIQRLVTPMVLQRKRRRLAFKKRRAVKAREDAAEYAKLLAQRAKEKQAEKIARRRSSASRSSQTDEKKPPAAKDKTPPATAKAPKPVKPPTATKGKPAPVGAGAGKAAAAKQPAAAKKPADTKAKSTAAKPPAKKEAGPKKDAGPKKEGGKK